MSFLILTMDFFFIWRQHGSSTAADLCYVMDMYFFVLSCYNFWYWSADKSLARPGRKQATVTEDFYVHIPYL